MPFWKIHNDLVTNVLLLEHEASPLVISTGYDGRIVATSFSGEQVAKRKLEFVPGTGTLVPLPVSARKYAEIKGFLVGSEMRYADLIMLSRELEEKNRWHTFKGTMNRITFIKASDVKGVNYAVAGSLQGFGVLKIKEEASLKCFHIGEIVNDGIIFQKDDSVFVAISAISSRKVKVFSLEENLELKPISDFSLPSPPVQITYSPEFDKLIISMRNGRVSLRGLDGEKYGTFVLDGVIAWKTLTLFDVDGDGEPEILVGSQRGEDETSKSARSKLYIFKHGLQEPLAVSEFKGWVKLIHPAGDGILLSVGKTIEIVKLETKEKRGRYKILEVLVQKFDKPPIAHSVLELGEKIFIALGFSGGEVGIVEFSKI